MAPTDPPAEPGVEFEGVVIRRRAFVKVLAGLGISGGVFPSALWARRQDPVDITAAVIAEAEKVAGLTFTDEEREMMVEGLRENQAAFTALRGIDIPDGTPPATVFDPALPGIPIPEGPSSLRVTGSPGDLAPPTEIDLAFSSLSRLGALLRERTLRSVDITRICLDRIARFDSSLESVITVTEARALEQADQADRELDAGQVRGPLHGIPWGAKDLLSVRGYPTTWGARPFAQRVISTDAAVVQRLDQAGAVLVAKTSLGTLARGDRWFGGRTRSPWNPEIGSSGSSAGSAAATVAGLLPFSVGSETIGSIVSPSARCGASALRPTFGRVARSGSMALSWSMDKLGPICRSAEDCAIVLAAINGADGGDPGSRDVPFSWDAYAGIEGLRIGYLEAAFAGPSNALNRDLAVLDAMTEMGAEMTAVELPRPFPIEALRTILFVESAASFDRMTLGEEDDQLTDQSPGAWPNTFRTARLVPGVEYVQAGRARRLLMEAVDSAWRDVDVIVTPTLVEELILATNLTGHPAAVVPNGFGPDGSPGSITFIGRVWGDAAALRVAHAYQSATSFHLRRPPAFS